MVLKGGGGEAAGQLVEGFTCKHCTQCLCNSHGYPFQLKCFRWSQSMVVLKTEGESGSDAVER